MGGMTKAVEAGLPKLRIEEASARKQARIDRGEDVVVGVNRYQVEGAESEFDLLEVDNSAVRDAQVERRVQAAPAGTRLAAGDDPLQGGHEYAIG